MTAVAGECNGRSEGSNVELEGSNVELEGSVGEFDRKRGGDLKEGDIACRDGEEIGGSFVIVSGDSDDHSDRDLDLEQKSYPSPAAENGELVPEKGEIGGKDESLAENGVEDGEKFSEENGDSDGELVEERSNGTGIDIEQEKEAEVDAEDEPHVVGSGSVNEAKLDSDAQIEGEEVGDDVDMVKSEASEKKDSVDSGSDVKIDHEEEETVESKDLGSGDAVEGTQDSEASGIVTEEEEVQPRVEEREREREAEVLIAESDAKVGLGSEDEEEDSKEPETVVSETDGLMKSESASPVEEEQEPASVMAEVDDKGDVVEVESKNSVNGVGETENAAGFESAVETELKQELQTEVEQTENVVELETAVKELQQESESNTGVEEAEESLESGSTVEVERAQEPDTAVDETDKTEMMDTAEVEELKEPKVLVEKNDNQAETGSAVEVEHEQEPETVLDSADNIDAEERKEPEDVGKVNTASEQLPLADGVPGKPNAVGDHPIDEPSSQPENGSTDSAGEISGDSLKDELNTEAGSIPVENSESLPTSHVTVKEFVEEVSHSSDDNIVKQGDINEGSVPSKPKTDVSSEERSLSGLVTGVDLEKQSEELCPHRDTETETKDYVANVEVDKDVAVDRMKQESESGNESAEGSECMISSTEGDYSTNKDDDKEPMHEQAQAAEMIQAPQETSVVKRHQVYMIKVPRFIDDELQKKIQDAGSEVEKKTDEREEISKETRKQAEIVNKYSLDYKAELAKERAARAVFSAKRQELEIKQELINRINNANSIADIDEKIRNMVHRQQHETISLKQEKQYIHDINQMKRLREQLSSKRASQEKIEEALSQRDEVEVQLKNLKKELDSQRSALSSAENNTKSAWNKYMDEVQLLKSLKEKHNAADGERQEAYLHLKKLRNQSAEKAKHFKMYKADQSAATSYIFSGDNQGLRSHCSRQVERIMDLWNNNAEFREQYVKYNMYSTLRRLGTLDGRSLGPGEEAPILRSHIDKFSNTISAPSSKIETPAPVLAAEVSQGNLSESSATKQVARTNQSAKSKSSTKPALVDHNVTAVSNSEVSKETEKENKLKKEEEELERKADELARKEEELRKEKASKEEELRKEKAAAELKEQLRLDQKAKANEAEERKRRKAEKAQAKAEYRAQKEAKLKEKKKAKKENKKSGTVDTTNGGTEGANSPVIVTDTNPSETPQEPEILSAATSKKRPARPASSMRQYNKVQPPVPLPLRIRGKRKMTAWMWALLIILLVLVLFFAGNYISFSTSGLPDFGF